MVGQQALDWASQSHRDGDATRADPCHDSEGTRGAVRMQSLAHCDWPAQRRLGIIWAGGPGGSVPQLLVARWAKQG